MSKLMPSPRRIVSKLQGSCLCRAIQWELQNIYVSQICVCHCGACQRHSGSTSLPFLAVERARLWPELEKAATLKGYKSSDIATRYFCNTCGTPVVHDYHQEEHTLWVPIGSLENNNSTVPMDPLKDSHIFCDDASAYERGLDQRLHRYVGFGLYKVDPCQPVNEWESLPTMETPVLASNHADWNGTQES